MTVTCAFFLCDAHTTVAHIGMKYISCMEPGSKIKIGSMPITKFWDVLILFSRAISFLSNVPSHLSTWHMAEDGGGGTSLSPTSLMSSFSNI